MPRFRVKDWVWVGVFALAVIVMIYDTVEPWLKV